MNWTLANNPVDDLEYDGACPERMRRNADGHVIEKTGSFAQTNLPQPVTGNTFNADNEMTAFNRTAMTGACPERSRGNANGNLTADASNTYAWDARNHLSAISGANAASFVYDPFGRPMSKTIGGTATSFLYDGLNPVQELQSGTPSANMLTGLGIDEYFQRTDASGASIAIAYPPRAKCRARAAPVPGPTPLTTATGLALLITSGPAHVLRDLGSTPRTARSSSRRAIASAL